MRRRTPTCFLSRGAAYRGQARPELALADFDRALELDPTLVAAFTSRARLHEEAGDFQAAVDDYTRPWR